jgi:hypothetical protein
MGGERVGTYKFSFVRFAKMCGMVFVVDISGGISKACHAEDVRQACAGLSCSTIFKIRISDRL